MSKRRACLGILIMTLVFGMIGCKSGDVEELLSGTWLAFERGLYKDENNERKYDIRDFNYKITFEEGTSEESVYRGTFYETFTYFVIDEAGKTVAEIENRFICKGNYIASGGGLSVKVTHFYGDYLGLEPRWYLIDEDEFKMDEIKEKFSVPAENKFIIGKDNFFDLPLIRLPQTYSYTISPSLKMTTTTDSYSVSTKYTKIGGIE
jgi:hypothetical protein